MTPETYLLITGPLFLLIAFLGFSNLVGDKPQQQSLGKWWFLDADERWGHLIFGILALGAYALGHSTTQLILISIITIAALWHVVDHLLRKLYNPVDILLDAIFGFWGVVVVVHSMFLS